jgi:hypothetical protein
MDSYDRIRQVLVHVWDPLRVSNQPECHDEYDFCLGRIVRLAFENDADASQITAFMMDVLRDEVGLRYDPDREVVSLKAAQKIVEIRDSLKCEE